MNIKKNAVQYSVALALAVLVTAPLFAFAEETYVPLAPVTSDPGEAVRPSSYIADLFKVGIGVASALAVLAIVYGGIKYMMSDVITNKSDAIGLIKNALLGLGIAIASFLILNTINPDLTNSSFLTSLDTKAPPARTPPSTGGGETNDVVLSYYAPRHDFTFQQYEFKLGYTLPPAESAAKGVSPGVQLRYTTRENCQSQKTYLQSRGYTINSLFDCLTPESRVKKYANYNQGTLITNLNIGTFTELSAQTESAASPETCEEKRNAFMANRDRRYEILSECVLNGNYGALQNKYFSSTADCFAEAEELPEGTSITKYCLVSSQQ